MYVCMYVCRDQCEDEDEGVQCLCDESVVLEEVTIEELTERHRMTGEERREVPFSCTQCGRHFSQPRYMQRHKCVTTRKKG